MHRTRLLFLAVFAIIQFNLSVALTQPSLGQERELKVKPRGTLKVVDLWEPAASAMRNYAEGLVTLDRDNNYVPCVAEDWRWVEDRIIEFKLRQEVTFHNGEKFNAEAVRVNWEEYRGMESPAPLRYELLPDQTTFEIIDDYTVRFTFPEPDGLALLEFLAFSQFAPTFFSKHKFDEGNWGFLSEPGPWGIGPFRLVEGGVRYARPSDRVVLEAFENYWDPKYPKVEKVIFDNSLIGDRRKAMRLCRETEGAVDIVSFVRPLDTLKLAESKFAKMVKSRDVTVLGSWFNQRKRDSKWRDVRLRRALNYAINRKELCKYGAKGNAYNLEGFLIPPGAYGHNPKTPYTYDTTKARSLLAKAGCGEGFDVKIITSEAWKLEAQIISRMFERTGLKVRSDILTHPELLRKICIPMLDKPPEEQDWDMVIGCVADWYGHAGASILSLGLIEDSFFRWIKYDPVYEEMWKDMKRTVDSKVQEEKNRKMVQYIYERALTLPIYSPLTLYAVNKEVDFVPQKDRHLRLKETSVTENHWSVRGKNN